MINVRLNYSIVHITGQQLYHGYLCRMKLSKPIPIWAVSENGRFQNAKGSGCKKSHCRSADTEPSKYHTLQTTGDRPRKLTCAEIGTSPNHGRKQNKKKTGTKRDERTNKPVQNDSKLRFRQFEFAKTLKQVAKGLYEDPKMT